jgi:hypothetical protein
MRRSEKTIPYWVLFASPYWVFFASLKLMFYGSPRVKAYDLETLNALSILEDVEMEKLLGFRRLLRDPQM